MWVKTEIKKEDGQKFVWTDRKHAAGTESVYYNFASSVPLSVYKLTFLRVVVETTSTTPLPYLNSLR